MVTVDPHLLQHQFIVKHDDLVPSGISVGDTVTKRGVLRLEERDASG